jgi:tetrapyrrole methylase family protein/MazG family protein
MRILEEFLMTNSIFQLLDIMQTLRSKDGCDWDRQQSLQSLKKYLLEEAYELIDAIDNIQENPSAGELSNHKEELGDVLFQVVFQAQIQSELGHFSFDDVAQSIAKKMIRRHPHIFATTERDPALSGNPFWHAIKEAENKEKQHGIFDSIAKSQPALSRAAKIGEKAGRLGFDWQNADDAFKKISEELQELKEAVNNNNSEHAAEEMGDLLHAIAQTARHLGLDPELCLHRGNEKFLARFALVLKLAGGEEKLKMMSPEEMLVLWTEAKN